MKWQKKSSAEIKKTVFEALNKNLNYRETKILGLPATYLDQEQFYFDAPFLDEAPFLSVLIANPNHIGCHTHSAGESYFSGTQALEVDLIKVCAEDIFNADAGNYDGYVASGGTEANIQAQWVFRNYFQKEHNAEISEIGLLFSDDAHYSAHKGCNILGIKPIQVDIDEKRSWDLNDLEKKLIQAKANGINYFIVHLSMGTTMFGSVDRPDPILAVIKKHCAHFFTHIDAAFGGFIYPFTASDFKLNLANPDIHSVTIDGHKMLQAPYGTGIFICKKGLMEYAQTEEASYVQGSDFTLCGSRSGANAVSIWMILMTHGYAGWQYLMDNLIDRTDHICDRLDQMEIRYFREPKMNIVAINAEDISDELAKKFHLVADNFESPSWWKIVVMTHAKKHIIDEFLINLQKK
ncbi:MAG: aspartate aminotransferase family protein [Crocinitomix sp.]|nr:aspartate aminotransferase family protein [Crocinitomix sp.]